MNLTTQENYPLEIKLENPPVEDPDLIDIPLESSEDPIIEKHNKVSSGDQRMINPNALDFKSRKIKPISEKELLDCAESINNDVESISIENSTLTKEDEARYKLEMEIAENGLPTFAIRRTPIEVSTDSTRYSKVQVKRLENIKDKRLVRLLKKAMRIPLNECMEENLSFNTETEKILKEIGIRDSRMLRIVSDLQRKFYTIKETIQRRINNVKYSIIRKNIVKELKKTHVPHGGESVMPSVPVAEASNWKLLELGHVREEQRSEDRTSPLMNIVRNKDNGVVVVTPGRSEELEAQFDGNYEVVEAAKKTAPPYHDGPTHQHSGIPSHRHVLVPNHRHVSRSKS